MSLIPFTDQQINDFLNNRSSKEEAEAIGAYFQEHIEELDAYMDFEAIPATELIAIPAEEKAQIYAGLQIPKSRIFPIRRYLQVACVILFVCLGTWATFHYLGKEKHAPSELASHLVLLENSSDHDQEFSLPDGSLVTLTAHAKLQYDSLQFLRKRDIQQLTGRIFYQVHADKTNPFTVHADQISTTAVGTKFWIEQEASKTSLKVHLLEGIVKLNSTNPQFELKDLFLEPGQICLLDLQNNKLHISEDADDGLTSGKSFANPRTKTVTNELLWTNKELVLQKINTRDLLNRLEDHYQVKIHADEVDLTGSTLTGKIYYKDNMDTILQAICELKGLSYRKIEGEYYLIKNNNQKSQ